MAVAAAETVIDREIRRSFDPLASVDLIQFDLATRQQVNPETMQRVMDEELTYIAEGINRPLKTSFTLREVDGQLSYFDRGEWKPYTGMLITGLKTAEQEALADPRKAFLAERAADDLALGYQMQKLEAGERISWYSPFPENELQKYGSEFVGGLGFQPQRRMGFLYQASRLADGSLRLDSQSVDNSNWQAYQAAMLLAERDPVATISEMRGAYDRVLELQTGVPHFAGKNIETANCDNACDDAWESINRHRDLLDYFFAGIIAIAENTELNRHERETAKKELTYGVWATLKQRLDSTGLPAATPHQTGYAPGQLIPIHFEVQRAFNTLSKRGEVLSGCGGSMGGRKDLLEADPSDVFDNIFGSLSEAPEKYDFDKEMFCVVCQAPPKKDAPKKKCGPCGICRGCDVKLSAKIK